MPTASNTECFRARQLELFFCLLHQPLLSWTQHLIILGILLRELEVYIRAA